MFTIRVYGLLINTRNEILLSKEYLKGFEFTKFPGGGLEFGEGTCDCLIREFQEELGIDIEVKEHFYTTDFFVASSFDASKQVISIYYLVDYTNWASIPTRHPVEDWLPQEGAQLFYWRSVQDLRSEELTFPIDKKVLSLLSASF